MRNYELTLLLPATLAEEQLQTLLGQIAGELQDQGALVMTQEGKGRRAFPAPIKKQREGCLALIKFTLDPAKIPQIQEILKGRENILRFLLLGSSPGKVHEPLMAQSAAPKETLEEKVELGEIDKKLEEIFKDEV